MSSFFIRHELEIDCAVEKIYEALTSETQLSRWWLPGAHVLNQVGTVAIFPLSDGLNHIQLRIEKMELNKTIEWLCLDHKHAEWIGTRILFDMESLGPQSSKLVFRHDGWKSTEGVFGKVSFYWASLYLSRLQKILEANE